MNGSMESRCDKTTPKSLFSVKTNSKRSTILNKYQPCNIGDSKSNETTSQKNANHARNLFFGTPSSSSADEESE